VDENPKEDLPEHIGKRVSGDADSFILGTISPKEVSNGRVSGS
jgi:hypothetical protein